MESPERQVLEDQVLASCTRGDFDAAATRASAGYGPEMLGFLAAVVGDLDAAQDVFSVWCEDVWRGLPSFQRRASVRTWSYALARHAAHRFFRRELKRADRQAPLDGTSLAAFSWTRGSYMGAAYSSNTWSSSGSMPTLRRCATAGSLPRAAWRTTSSMPESHRSRSLNEAPR